MDVVKFLLLAISVSGVSSACVTPNNENGTCVPLRNCSSLMKMTQVPEVSAETKAFLRKSICQKTNQQIIVCCPLETDHDCTDPEGKKGLCVPLPFCPNILRMTEKKDQLSDSQLRFLRESRCSPKKEKVKVCCSSAPTESRDDAAGGNENVGGDGNSTLLRKLQEKRLPRAPECGVELGDRIFGGTETKFSEFLWTVSLNYKTPIGKSGIYCGGSIISARYVLTAAHCITITTRRTVLQSVRIGDWDLDNEKDCDEDDDTNCLPPPIDIAIEETIVHSDYNKTIVTSPNDIALLRLAEKIEFGGLVKPICLPYEPSLWTKDYTGKIFTTTGWGITENDRTSSIKLKVNLPYVTTARCDDVFSSNNIKILDSQLCAGGERGKDSCGGDSGGPLMSKNLESPFGYWYITGLTSYGTVSCGVESVPGIYTKISSHLEWILNNMKE